MRRFSRRKWGWYLTLIDRKHFKVKLLRFHSGKNCSYQYHSSRNELWLFLTGLGNFFHEGKRSWGEPGEFKIVQAGEKHKYFAIFSTFVLEIQYGDKCDESDIVRVA